MICTKMVLLPFSYYMIQRFLHLFESLKNNNVTMMNNQFHIVLERKPKFFFILILEHFIGILACTVRAELVRTGVT